MESVLLLCETKLYPSICYPLSHKQHLEERQALAFHFYFNFVASF